MSPDDRLLSVAEIARRLSVPESTVHYWKNRFAQHLPSSGAGRQKRFRVEAVDVFRVIAEMFSLGHSAQDVMDALGKRFALTASVDGAAYEAGSEPAAPYSPPRREAEGNGNGLCTAAVADTALRLAAGIAKDIGQEIARHVGESLRQHLGSPPSLEGAGAQLALGSEELNAIKATVDQSCSRIDANAGEVARMAMENAELKAKLSVLESELIRLRKDRRELEKYLLDKIKSVTT